MAEKIIKSVLARKRMKMPELVFKCIKLFEGRTDYASGLTIGDIARALYGEDSPRTRDKARHIITRARKFLMETSGLYIYGASGPEGYRYYIPGGEDYSKVIEALNRIESSIREARGHLAKALSRLLEEEGS